MIFLKDPFIKPESPTVHSDTFFITSFGQEQFVMGKIYCVSRNYSFEWYEPGLQSDYHLQAAVCECKVAALLPIFKCTSVTSQVDLNFQVALK